MDHHLALPWLLVATPQLTDPNFRQTVVLVVEQSDSGAVGFVLNRPLQTPLASLITAPDVQIPAQVAAWYAGPVEIGTGVILQDRTPPEARLSPHGVSLNLSSSDDALAKLAEFSKQRLAALARVEDRAAEAAAGLYPFRFLVGYAGWGEGQLEEELHAGAWIQVRASWTLLFGTDWRMLWDAALGAAGASARSLAPVAHAYLN